LGQAQVSATAEFIKLEASLLDIDAFCFIRCAQCLGDNGLRIDRKRSPQEVHGYGMGNLSPNTLFADDTFAIVESVQNMDHRQPL
jgi:hypothetical protein